MVEKREECKKSKSICPSKDLYVNIRSSVIHNSPKSKFPSSSEQINKMSYIRKMEYHSAVKGKEVLICATT